MDQVTAVPKVFLNRSFPKKRFPGDRLIVPLEMPLAHPFKHGASSHRFSP